MSQETAAAPATTTQPSRTEALEAHFLDALNGAGLMLMSSVGHRTGLFAAMADGVPRTSAGLAEHAGLHERYVREWLGAMVTGGIVDYDPLAGTYRLPPEHATLLTDSGEANLAVFAQYVSVLGSVEDGIVRCFREGGGLPYSAFPRFHEVMAEDSGQSVLPALVDHILPLAPELPARLEAGIRVLDVACGRGRALLTMAARYPNSSFTGYDLSSEAIDWARAAAHEAGLANVTFEVRDLSDFDTTATPEAFDLITVFDGIHDQAQPRRLLAGVRRSLAPEGVFLVQDIHASSHPDGDREHALGGILYAVSCMHCMTVSLAQGGEGLGAMWGRKRATQYLRDAGFGSVSVHTLPHDPQNDYFVCRLAAQAETGGTESASA